jgi:hypothetical protein
LPMSKTATVLIPNALQPLLLPLSKLTEYPRNAQKHTPEDIEAFRKVLREFGWTNPIVAWGKNGTTFISAGHLRYNAAKAEGLTEVPVLVRRDWTERQFRAYTIADNQWTRRASIVPGLLVHELVDLESEGFDLSLVGYDDSEVRKMIDGTDDDETQTLFEQAVQLQPAREYIVVMCETGDEWERLKAVVPLDQVRRGYKPGTDFDAVSTERVIPAARILERLSADSHTK